MNGYERRKQKKIEQIFNVSLQLFVKHGFQKVSVNEIAQTANVSPATIYNYFGTKERLYADMLMDWMDKQLELYEEVLRSGLSFPDKTKKLMLLEAKNLKILSEEFLNVPSSSSELGGLPEMMDSYSRDKVMRFFMKFVAMGKQEGYIRDDQTEETTILYFTMYKNELGRQWEAGNQELIHRSMDALMELFFFGLVGQAREEGERSDSQRNG